METTVGKENMSASDVLNMFPGMEGGTEVLTSTPHNILSNDVNLSFLDKPDPGAAGTGSNSAAEAAATATETPEAKAEREKKEIAGNDQTNAAAAVQPIINKTEADKILDSIGKPATEDVEDTGEGAADEGKKGGRDVMVSYLKSKIEGKQFLPFDDFDEKKETIDQYLAKQPIKTLHQLLDSNMEAKEKEILERTPKEFFQALPESLQYVTKAAMNGASESQLATLYGILSRVEQTKNLDPETEDGQIQIARTYLQTTGFGRGKADVIEKQVAEWKEIGKLAEKAQEFKPDLDEMQKEQVKYQLAQQEEWSKQQRAAAQAYVGNVHKALEKAEINGIKLDRQTQADIYNGLTNVTYESASGRPTNLLGHLLDKIQYIEPDFALLAEVTYLLSNPEAYRNSIKQAGKNEGDKETFRKLKTEEQLGNTLGGGGAAVEDTGNTGQKKKLSKPANMFDKTNWK